MRPHRLEPQWGQYFKMGQFAGTVAQPQLRANCNYGGAPVPVCLHGLGQENKCPPRPAHAEAAIHLTFYAGQQPSLSAGPALTGSYIGRQTCSRPAASSSWHLLPGTPRGYRCRLCFETDFANRGYLAEHLVSGRSAQQPPGRWPIGCASKQARMHAHVLFSCRWAGRMGTDGVPM